MNKVVLFGGTSEGRYFAEALANTDIELHICVATEYGRTLLPYEKNIIVHIGRLDAEEMAELFAQIQPELCIDATHPYAEAVTKNIEEACQKCRIPYRKIIREESNSLSDLEEKKDNEFENNSDNNSDNRLSDSFGKNIVTVASVKEAAKYLSDKSGNILITTGSKELEEYLIIPEYRSRCFARVLPTEEVMHKCHELGFEGRNLIGMQGPFDEEFNICLINQISAKYLVTKSSGSKGGFDEKYRAAVRTGITLVIVRRPE